MLARSGGKAAGEGRDPPSSAGRKAKSAAVAKTGKVVGGLPETPPCDVPEPTKGLVRLELPVWREPAFERKQRHAAFIHRFAIPGAPTDAFGGVMVQVKKVHKRRAKRVRKPVEMTSPPEPPEQTTRKDAEVQQPVHPDRQVPPHLLVEPMPVQSDLQNHEDIDPEHRAKRQRLLRVLKTTDSASDAWNAYHELVSLPHHGTKLCIPWEHLHQLARLIASTRPRTRTLFIRLFSVISTIRNTGGTVRLWQWNALMDFAGKGWRKSTPESFRTASDLYNDLVSQNPPGTAFSGSSSRDDNGCGNPSATEPQKPDIITYNTLLNIAGRTLHEPTLHRAQALLAQSGYKPDRITYLCLLAHYMRVGRLHSVRSVLGLMASENMELGLDGATACITAFGFNNRLDVAMSIYRVLKANIDPILDPETEQLREELADDNIRVPRDVGPNGAVYASLMQAYAYHGDLNTCLSVFMDLVATVPMADEPAQNVHYYNAYRSIFLGFARHGINPADEPLLRTEAPKARWTFGTLQTLFDDFIRVAHLQPPSSRMLHWILRAFSVTSGDDPSVMRAVQAQLEQRFGGAWKPTGRLARWKDRIWSGPEPGEESEEEDVDGSVEEGPW